MSFYAVTATNKRVNAEDFHPFEREELFCPSCGCKMHYVSAVSNRRAAHFSGKHLPGCDIGSASSDSVNPYHYELPENSVQGLFDLILRQGVKQPSSKGSANSKHGTPTGTERKGTINTIRKLFAFCTSVDPFTILPDGKRVKDIYCGKSTTFLYKTFVSGLHLMYAQYSGYSDDHSALSFCYPSAEKKEIHFAVTVKSKKKNVLEAIEETLVVGNYALIFAKFTDTSCLVDSAAQVVPIKKPKR